ncbi:MAG: hypothetical protein ACPG49_13455, partial [Chitinophagales bacterium]
MRNIAEYKFCSLIENSNLLIIKKEKGEFLFPEITVIKAVKEPIKIACFEYSKQAIFIFSHCLLLPPILLQFQIFFNYADS